ncbi:MAG: DUF1905 domain-containing protein [Mariniphaga sp.]|nr:DUF1905 domain-containing protein [Mariniphaga sp.]
MSKTWEFEAFLYQFAKGGFYVDIPYDGKKEFGTRASVRVYAWFDGYKYRTSLAPKGNDTHWVHVRKEIREAIGKGDGDTILVKLELDMDSRDPEMPEDLLWLLENEPKTKVVFDQLSPSTRKYLIDSVILAKTENTRIDKINRLFAFLYQKKNE